MHRLDLKSASRIAGFAAATAAVLAAAVHLRHAPNSRRPDTVAGAPEDALARELDRCREIGMAAKDDPACAAAWAENRRRFYAPLSSAPSLAPSSDARPR